ncbi:MAG: hypothetical protein ACTSWY_11250 [Promethearchaeota archaeon]
MSLDIFDRYDNYFKRKFRNFSLFGNDWDDLLKEFNESVNSTAKDGKSKNYKMSYHFKTGMDEPEILVEGDVTQEDIDHFLSGVQKRFGKHFLEVGEKNVKMIDSGDENKEKKIYRIPQVTKSKQIASETFKFEMPGVNEVDIKTKIQDGKLTVEAEKDKILYKKVVKTELSDDSNLEISSNNGIITIKVTPVEK